ncbi:MAG: M14 family zinc carboxypeptidase [Pseudomonadota bacterium]
MVSILAIVIGSCQPIKRVSDRISAETRILLGSNSEPKQSPTSDNSTAKKGSDFSVSASFDSFVDTIGFGIRIYPVTLSPKPEPVIAATDADDLSSELKTGKTDSTLSKKDAAKRTAVESTPAQNQMIASQLAPDLIGRAVVRPRNNLLFCHRIDRKLRSVTFRSCVGNNFVDSGFATAQGEPIFQVSYAKNSVSPIGKVLVLGGVHGDELTSVSSVFIWLDKLNQHYSGLFEWMAVPLVNPDGFFRKKSIRTNANGIDLNRNLPTANWHELANKYWKKYAKSTARKYPGLYPASEPETQWLLEQLDVFDPDVIITVHAPYNLVDFDAKDRSDAPRRLGILRGRSLGTFPGSLGRYAGEERNIPVITLELPHSSKMPSEAALNGIWNDLADWLRQNVAPGKLAGVNLEHCRDDGLSAGCL